MSTRVDYLQAPVFIKSPARASLFASRRSESAGKLQELEERARDVCSANPDLLSFIGQKWQMNISHGGDGVKAVLERLKLETPAPIKIPDHLFPGSDKTITLSDEHDDKRKLIDDIEVIIQQIDGW